MKTDNFEIFEEYNELKNDAMGVSEGCQSRILGTRFSKNKKILKFFFDFFWIFLNFFLIFIVDTDLEPIFHSLYVQVSYNYANQSSFTHFSVFFRISPYDSQNPRKG